MEICKYTSLDELEYCVKMYISFDSKSIVEMNEDAALFNLKRLVKANFFRLIKEDGVIHGWILAGVTRSLFGTVDRLEQQFYVSDFKGFKAARAVILAHDALITEATKRKLKQVYTHASHLDYNSSLCKILERRGWKAQGYIAYLDL